MKRLLLTISIVLTTAVFCCASAYADTLTTNGGAKIDCADLEYMSSAGLRVLLTAHMTMSTKGGMKLLHVSIENRLKLGLDFLGQLHLR